MDKSVLEGVNLGIEAFSLLFMPNVCYDSVVKVPPKKRRRACSLKINSNGYLLQTTKQIQTGSRH